MIVLRKSFYIRWSAGRSPRVPEVNPGRDPSHMACMEHGIAIKRWSSQPVRRGEEQQRGKEKINERKGKQKREERKERKRKRKREKGRGQRFLPWFIGVPMVETRWTKE